MFAPQHLPSPHALSENEELVQRVEGLTLLAGRVAHDANGALAYVLLQVDRLERLANEGDMGECVDAIHEGIAHLRGLLRELQEIGLGERADRVRQIVPDVIARAVRISGASDVAVTSSYSGVPCVEAGVVELTQVFVNVLCNAVDASATHVRVTIAPDAHGRVVIRIADDGVGVKPSVLPRAFDPRVTTKSNGHERGFGLWSARSTIEKLGGEIRMESELGSGTVVTLVLPAAQS